MMMPHSQVNRLLVDFEYGTEAAKKVTEGRFYLDLIFKLTTTLGQKFLKLISK